MSVEQLSENCFVSKFATSAAAITFSDKSLLENRDNVVTTGRLNKHIRSWGKNNNLPQYREQVLMDNNIIASLVSTKCEITLGAGLFAFKEVFVSDGGKRNIEEVPMPAKAKEFFDKVDIETYLEKAIKNYFIHANVFTEFTRKKGGEIDMMTLKECRHTRAGVQNEQGVINNYYLFGAWARNKNENVGSQRNKAPIPVPAYRADATQPKFMYHTGDPLLGDDYYYVPPWWGGLNWIELANAIPIFHRSNILNGYTLRFHIEVPQGYFEESATGTGDAAIKKAKEKAVKKKEAFMQRVNELLQGLDNTGRTLFTEYKLNVAMGKEFPGIKITPINVDIKDEALLKLFEKSNEANISAQGIHPTLANIQTQGKLSSGSEMLRAFQVYLITKTPKPRRILLKPIHDLVRKINKWDPEIHFGFRDIELTTLDEEPSGKREVQQQ